MEKVILTEKEKEAIASAFVNQRITPPEKGEFYYFTKEEAQAYIYTYLEANQNANYIYGLEGRQAFVIIRRENEYLKLWDILKMIYRSYKILGIRKVNKIQNLERNGPLALEEKYALKRKKFLFVGMVVVLEEYQGQGYFRELMQEIFATSVIENRTVILNTDTQEKCMKYKHVGFSLEQKRVLEEGNVRYDLIWEK